MLFRDHFRFIAVTAVSIIASTCAETSYVQNGGVYGGSGGPAPPRFNSEYGGDYPGGIGNFMPSGGYGGGGHGYYPSPSPPGVYDTTGGYNYPSACMPSPPPPGLPPPVAPPPLPIMALPEPPPPSPIADRPPMPTHIHLPQTPPAPIIVQAPPSPTYYVPPYAPGGLPPVVYNYNYPNYGPLGPPFYKGGNLAGHYGGGFDPFGLLGNGINNAGNLIANGINNLGGLFKG